MSIVYTNPFLDKAWNYGEEDGRNGVESRAGAYFIVGNAAWDAYHLAYLVGMARRQTKRLAGGSEVKPVSEAEFMDECLSKLRSGAVEPILRYTDKMLAEIEDQRPGD